MISGALCPSHGSSNLHFIQVTALDNDVVNEVPAFGPGMNPRSLVHVTGLEEGVCDSKSQFRAEREQSETATIHVANTMMTNDSSHMSLFLPTLGLNSHSNMVLTFCVILRRVEYNVS